jgi:beta-galactosidase
MKIIKYEIIAFLLCAVFCIVHAEPHSRVKQNIDFNWYFHPGDIPNGHSNNVSYSSWRKLDIPHDWSIEGSYDENAPGKNRVGFLPTGIGWYKKEIEWNDSWKNKLVFIEFGGIFMNSTVWLNGNEVGFRPNGYLNLGYELTPYLKQGENVLTVKVDNSLQPSARWYTGSGIYRHVDLIITDPIHVTRNGTYVRTPEVSRQSSVVQIDVEIENKTGNETPVNMVSIITDQNGKEVARKSQKVQLQAHLCCPQVVNEKMTVSNPALWSPETPAVYYLNTIIEKDGKELDDYTTRFGIRKLEYDTISGFKLNGVAMKMKGVCIHQDAAPAGSAINEDILHHRLVMLKEMGCNAIRTTHHPFADEFYAMCDTMGFMVMDEPWDGWFGWENNGKAEYDYGYYFLNWWEKDLQDFIRRDRNYPCVVMWSAGNEVWGWDKHLYLQWKIVDNYHKMDPTRPVTQAWADGKYIDIAGFNGNGEDEGNLSRFHKEQHGKLGVGTEIPHSRATRGVYFTIGAYRGGVDFEDISNEAKKKLFPLDSFTAKEVFPEFDRHYASGYDNQTRRISIREQWKQTRDNDFFIGEFRWTGFDYLGESWGWPARTNNYGVIDLAEFPKDAYYLYQSLWTDKPMIHLLPHWTWHGKEGIEIPVVAYTNGDAAELFFNGKSLGKKTMDPNVLQIVWMVPYQSGTLTAIAYKNGKKVASESVSTASEPSVIKLIANRTTMKANRRDIVYVEADIMDAKGRFVPIANNQVEFEVTGPYKLIGTENGDILDVSSAKSLSKKVFMGKLLLMLQATGESGTLTITAKSPGLQSAKVSVKCL